MLDLRRHPRQTDGRAPESRSEWLWFSSPRGPRELAAWRARAPRFARASARWWTTERLGGLLSAGSGAQSEPHAYATGTPDAGGDIELASSCAKEVDQVGRRMKRVGKDDAIGECERCSEVSVDFGEQD